MNSTIKGVRYSYQISYMNQAPTHLKSQIHNLPVVSEPQQTPLDISQNQDQYIPSNDARMSYAAPTAAVSATPSVNEVSGGATTIPSARSTMATGGIGYAGPQRINAPTDVNPLLTETNISEPQQVARAAQAESVVSHPALSVAAQAGLDGNLGNVLHPTQNFIGIDKIFLPVMLLQLKVLKLIHVQIFSVLKELISQIRIHFSKRMVWKAL